ncbi:CRISPR-associated endonuclease Cas2 [Patescibacteria group bacterium]|nr:CRISPR-associated endonuclease Cas2 [Patescibacteria group bacterium]MBU1705133.1 CRISPR-associated endonuclease Cas2 [Patescibacteria group bacterium]
MCQKNNIKQRHLAKGSVAASLLTDLVDQLDLTLTVGYKPVAVARYGLDGVLRMRKANEYKQRRQALTRLHQGKLIKISKNAENYTVALTESGLIENYRLQVLNAEEFEDNRFCIVIFDVPERHRRLRSQLRSFLKEAGFHRFQQSVWISPFNATKPLLELFRASNAKGWVRVYTATEEII